MRRLAPLAAGLLALALVFVSPVDAQAASCQVHGIYGLALSDIVNVPPVRMYGVAANVYTPGCVTGQIQVVAVPNTGTPATCYVAIPSGGTAGVCSHLQEAGGIATIGTSVLIQMEAIGVGADGKVSTAIASCTRMIGSGGAHPSNCTFTGS